MESLEKEVNDITSLLADGELLPAIDKSLLLAKNRNESLYENLVQLRSRYKYFEKNRRDGIISYQDQTIEIASLNRYLIEHLSDLRKISQGSNQLDWVPNTIETLRIEITKLNEQHNESLKRLRELTIVMRINQKLLSKKLGFSLGYVSQIYSGQRSISGRFLTNLTTIYPEINVDWLLTGKGEMFRKNTIE